MAEAAQHLGDRQPENLHRLFPTPRSSNHMHTGRSDVQGLGKQPAEGVVGLPIDR